MIPFPQRFVEYKVGAQSKRYVKILEKIHTNVPLTKVLSRKRKLEECETGEIINDNRGRLAIMVRDENVEFINTNLLKPPLQIQRNEPSHRKKIKKSNGYKRWLDRWSCVPMTTKFAINGSSKKEPPWVSYTQGPSS